MLRDFQSVWRKGSLDVAIGSDGFGRTLALRQMGRELLLAQSSDWAFFDEDRNGSPAAVLMGRLPPID